MREVHWSPLCWIAAEICIGTCLLYTSTANAKAEFRYSPANNGNGGLKIDFKDKKVSGNFFANIKNARFTGKMCIRDRA